MGSKRKFNIEYKKEIIKLVRERGNKVSEVAKDIGVSETTIRNWVKKYSEYGEEAFPGRGKLRTEDAEIREMKKKLKDLEEENAILKKAMGIFSRDMK